ncbi:MAG: SPFH domain-containing protein [Planctomycetota bacterium]|nr:SPFH domain-containing protein [Planctomycetota bacterium]
MQFPLFVAQGADAALALTIIATVLVVMGMVILLAKRYKRCPSNRVLVIYGRTGKTRAARSLHGGGAFVWPLIQSYDYLSLDPIQIEIPLQGALSMENIRVSVPSVFTVAIGTDPDGMTNAAVRLLGLETREIMKQAEDIIFGQLRQVIASMRIEEINRDRDVFLEKIQSSLEPELKKIGLVLINVNIKDITDESGYIEAIGRKAAAEAIQQAQIDVAQQEKKGAIGVADAEREQAVMVSNAARDRDIGTTTADRERAVQVADLERERVVGEKQAEFTRDTAVKEAEREMRIEVADANAKAVAGENEAKAHVAGSNADLRVREAEAFQEGESRYREAEAAVLEAQYKAQTKAAIAEAEKLEAEKRAQLEAVARAVKAQTIVDAEALAAKQKIEAEGEASAIFAKLDAEARGNYEILAKKGEGLRTIIEACGNSQQAFQMMMLEHLDKLSETAATAISNIKFDKVVVWDGGKGQDSGTSGFLRGLASALPPMMQIMKDVGGVEMPEYFGKLVADQPGDDKDDDKDDDKGDAKAGAKGGAARPAKARASKKPKPGA